MDSTMTIDAAQLEGLAERLAALDDVLDDADKVALLAVFALAGEALDARVDDKLDVSGFALNAYNVGIQVGVPSSLPGLGDGLLGAVGRKAGRQQQEFLVVTMKDVTISSSH